MEKKIITIAIVILMLTICVIMITSMNIVNTNKEQDLVRLRTEGSVLLTNGSLSDGNIIKSVRGTTLLSGIAMMYEIESSLSEGAEWIYRYPTDIDGYGNVQPSDKYSFQFNDSNTSVQSLVAGANPLIRPNMNYDIVYYQLENGRILVNILSQD